MPGSKSETRYSRDSVMAWAATSWYSVGSIIAIHNRVTTRSMWTGWVIRCISWSKRYFRTKMQFPKQQFPHSHSWNCSDMVWNHEDVLKHLPWPARLPHLNIIYSGQFWRLEWRRESHLQYLWSSLNMFFEKNEERRNNFAREFKKFLDVHSKKYSRCNKTEVCTSPY